MIEKEFARFAGAWPEPMLLTTGDGKVLCLNQAATRELTVPGESLVGVLLADHVSDSAETLGRFLKHCRRSPSAVPGILHWRCMKSDEEQEVDYRVEGALVRPEGDEGPALIQLRLRPKDTADRRFQTLNRRISDLSREIHARRRAEESLVESHRHQEYILESTGVGLWMAEFPLGNLDWDKRTRKLMFVDDEIEPTIDLFYQRLHPDDRDPVRVATDKSIAEHKPYDIDHRVIDPESGEVRWLSSSGAATYSPDGECVRFDGITHDVTDRKSAEAELRLLADQLADADKRKDIFLATLAHELRNPLSPIRTGLEILRMKADDVDIVRKMQETMERQVQQLTVLVNDLLDISRITRDKIEIRPELCNLRQIVDDAIAMSRPLLERSNHSLKVELPETEIELTADPHRLTQIVSNLLNNAAKYTPREGNVGLTVAQQGDEILIRVADDGMGIPAEDLDQIFEVFQQLTPLPERTFEGLGIGLTLVKNLTELHGGTVTVFSEGPGKGSVFEVRLPCRADS